MVADAERYRGYLLFLAELHVGPAWRDRLDLEGVVQQTLLDAWQKAPDCATPAAWLRRALGQNLADAWRRATADKRDARRARSLEAELEASSARLAGVLAADQSSPSARAARDERAVVVVEALGKLPPAQRAAVVAHHWHGRSLAEVAAEQGKTPAAVAGLLKRGLKTLRTLLGEP